MNSLRLRLFLTFPLKFLLCTGLCWRQIEIVWMCQCHISEEDDTYKLIHRQTDRQAIKQTKQFCDFLSRSRSPIRLTPMSDESDAKQILTASLLEETTGTPPYYVDEDYPARPEIYEPPLYKSSQSYEVSLAMWDHTETTVHSSSESVRCRVSTWMGDHLKTID